MRKLTLLLLLATLFAFSVLEAGSPAARQGDVSAHSGTILQGSPNVLVNGQPMARVGDHHTCPAFSGTVPHVGGPISSGSATVLVNGMRAATVGSAAVCVGSPDTIVQGSPTVLIGN